MTEPEAAPRTEAGKRERFEKQFAEATAIDAGTHQPAVDDFGNQYLVRLIDEAEPGVPELTADTLTFTRKELQVFLLDAQKRAMQDHPNKYDGWLDGMALFGAHAVWLFDNRLAALRGGPDDPA